MRRFLLLSSLAAAFASGCDSECANSGRFDGQWAVWSYAIGDGATFTGIDEAEVVDRATVMQAAFPNGWSTWGMKYVPSDSAVALDVDGQRFDAEYEEDAGNCNVFAMAFSGQYTSEVVVTHAFDWTGELTFMGDHLTGTFSYSDTWTSQDGLSGTFEIPSGELVATFEGDGAGF